MLPLGRGVVLSALAFTCLWSACVKHLPPAPMPEARVPAVKSAGKLIVDVTDGPTPVRLVRMAPQIVSDAQGKVHIRFVETPELLCPASPCVADPPAGTNVLLGFPVFGSESLETELVHVDQEPTIYRRTLSQYHTTKKGALYVLGIIATSLGGTSIATGTTLLPIGLAEHSNGLTVAGGITLVAGAALLVAGIWAIRDEADTYRPGSAIHFALRP
jgi:hypothetical protein